MGKFTSTTNHQVALTEIDLPVEGAKRIHLVGMIARVAADIALKIEEPKYAGAVLKASPFNGPQGIWVVDLTGKAIGKTKLTAQHQGKEVASTLLNMFTKTAVVLPAPDTDHGLLTRLLLVESINPGDVTRYDETSVKKAMQWMRLVIENRLNHRTPEIFNIKLASESKVNMYSVVKAPGQFHGFEDYPKLAGDIDRNLNQFLAITNNYNHPQREKYVAFVRNAIEVAGENGLKEVRDPSVKGLYGWRTEGSSEPGGSFKKHENLAGQTFYTLK